MQKKIYYHDTDSGGVVYYANYLKYLEEGRTEYFEQKGLSLSVLRDRQFFYAVSKCNLTYKSPARYGDVIICETELTKATAVKLIFDQKVLNKQSGQLLVEAEVVLVSLNKDFKPTQIPEEIKSKLLAR